MRRNDYDNFTRESKMIAIFLSLNIERVKWLLMLQASGRALENSIASIRENGNQRVHIASKSCCDSQW